MGARALPGLPVLDQRQRDMLAERRRIAAGGDVTDGAVRIGLVELLNDVRAAETVPAVPGTPITPV